MIPNHMTSSNPLSPRACHFASSASSSWRFSLGVLTVVACFFILIAALEAGTRPVHMPAAGALAPPNVVRTIAFSPDGKLLAAGADDGGVVLWDVASGTELVTLHGHAGPVRAVVFTPDGLHLISAAGDRPREFGELLIWDVEQQQLKKSLVWAGGPINAISVSSDGALLAAGGADGAIRLWQVSDWAERTAFRPHLGSILALAFKPGTHHLASAAEDDCIKLWDAENGRVACKLDAADGGIIFALAFAPDARSLVSTHGSDQTLRVWDLETRKLKRCCRDTLGHVRGVAFSPDGSLLATAAGLWSEPGDVGLQPMCTSAGRVALKGHSNVAYCVAFAPNGLMLATGSGDATVRLWDVRAASEVRTLRTGG